MRILTIDTCKPEVDFYMRCMEDGHKVKSYIRKDEESKNIGKGILDIVDDWRSQLDWADIIFMADNSKYLDQMDKVRAMGHKVFGPTAKSAKWELDRQYGQDIFDKCGIDTIPSESFTSYEDAIAYVQKVGGRLVCKPNGEAAKELSYVSKSPEDMLFMLGRWKKLFPEKPHIIIQEFIPGIEMAVGGWFGPHGFNKGWLENFEFKKLMAGDIGCNTGEMGTLIRYVKDSKLADEMLVPLEEELKKTGHTGYVDVAVIIDKKGQPWPLEFTMRPGYPTFNIQQELHNGDCADWMLDLLEGEDADMIDYNTIACGVVIAIPDFPYNSYTKKEVSGIPIFGLDEPLEKCYHPCEVMREKDKLVTAGSYVMVCTGTGETVSEASEAAYKAIEQINIPGGMMWRNDIGERLKKQLPKLHKHGYALGFEYNE